MIMGQKIRYHTILILHVSQLCMNDDNNENNQC